MTARGRCRVCRTVQRLDVDGRLAQHLHRPFPDQPDAVESCAGVGYLPGPYPLNADLGARRG